MSKKQLDIKFVISYNIIILITLRHMFAESNNERSKIMKATTRFLAFVFAAVMLLSLASCADNKGNNNEITTAPEATVDGEVTEELYLGYEKDRLPTNLSYNNETVKVLYWSDAERKEFEIK